MDFFRDYFTGEALMATLAEQPYTPGQIGELGLFDTIPLPGTILALETLVEAADALPTAVPRGTPGNSLTVPKGKVNTFTTSHYKKGTSIVPDEVLNMRAPGGMQRQTIEQRRALKLSALRRDMDRLHEKLRVGILKAPATASDGQSLYGSAASGISIAFTNSATKVRQEIQSKILDTIESALDGLSYTGYTVVLERAAWEKLIDSPYVNNTYLNTQQASDLRNGLVNELTMFGGRWIRYRGDSLIDFTANHGVVIPTGVRNLFVQGFAPADTMDQIGRGALGSPYYVESSMIDDGNRGVKIDIQTNVAMVCTRPGAVIDITLS